MMLDPEKCVEKRVVHSFLATLPRRAGFRKPRKGNELC